MSTKPRNEGLINTVNEIIDDARNRGIIHLYTDDQMMTGRKIPINGSSYTNFGSCSYLGLELDQRLKVNAQKAIDKYGTQYSSSRTYVSCGLYAELEELLREIFGPYVILSTCSSMAHQAVMPIVIGGNDALIYDQQAHVSMQEMSYKLQYNGTHTTLIRHSRLDLLEEKIKELSVTHDKVWYAIDGIYSMYGDYAPIEQLVNLLNKYRKFHLYIDDAHGMSWAGEHGSGYIKSKISGHERMILCTSLAKGFGSAGGVTVFPNEEMYQKVKNWGGPLTYSGPQQPGTLGASIASARIHLSTEIYDLQESLVHRIQYCQSELQNLGLPVVNNSVSPVLFLGLGLPKVAYNMIARIMNDGHYSNLGIFPAVPEACTGMRFTINNHLEKNDIDALVKSIAYHLPKAMKEESRSAKDLKRAFKKVANVGKWDEGSIEGNVVQTSTNLRLETYDSIELVDKPTWNERFIGRGLFHYEGLKMLERVFNSSQEPANDWRFKYVIVKDHHQQVVLATFLTSCIMKDDMLSPADISRMVELERKEKKDPMHLTSRAIMMGCGLSDGDHLFLNRNHDEWRNALDLAMKVVTVTQEEEKAGMLFMRDFHENDVVIKRYFQEQGFVKLDMPVQNHVDLINVSSMDQHIERLKSKRRTQLKRDVIKHEDQFQLTSPAEYPVSADQLFALYLNVKKKNLGLNTFELPIRLFHEMLTSDIWDVALILFNGQLCSYVASTKSGKLFCPTIIGMDYETEAPQLYKQTIYQAMNRSIELSFDMVNLGMAAEETKAGFGAKPTARIGFVQMKDHFNANYLSLIVSRTRLNALKKKGLNPQSDELNKPVKIKVSALTLGKNT